MKLQLPNNISSPQDLMALELELRDYAKWFAHNAIKERTHARAGTPPPALSSAAMQLVRDWSGKKLLTQHNLEDLIDALGHYKSQALTLTITLAAPAPSSLKQTLVGWCREHIAPNILVNFQFNSTLLGGMVIRYGSRIFDLSFRRQIMDGRAKFPEVLRNV